MNGNIMNNNTNVTAVFEGIFLSFFFDIKTLTNISINIIKLHINKTIAWLDNVILLYLNILMFNTFVDRYSIITPIGAGAFGQVYKVQHKHNGQILACKKVPKKIVKDGIVLDNMSRINREMNIWHDVSDLQHVCPLHEVCDDAEQIYFIQDLCSGGTLNDYVGKLSEQVIQKYMYTILCGLVSIHQKNILYGDLKPHNIMINNDLEKELKFIDFGCSRYLHKDQILRGITGTPVYCAPEIWDMKLTMYADSWSFGVLLYYMLSQNYPFWEQKSSEDISISKIKLDVKTKEIVKHKSISKYADDLITKMLEKNYRKRLSCEDALQHPWFLS
jgi:serine/threonine protein kinase